MSKRKREARTKHMEFPVAIEHAVANLTSPQFSAREDTQSTIGSLQYIIELNRRGLLSFDSQEGMVDSFTKERAYIAGFMIRDHARKVMRDVMVSSDKIFLILPVDKKSHLNSPQFTRAERIPLTVSVTSGNTETSGSISIPLQVFEHERKQLSLKKHKDLVYVFAFDPVFGRQAKSESGLWRTLLSHI